MYRRKRSRSVNAKSLFGAGGHDAGKDLNQLVDLGDDFVVLRGFCQVDDDKRHRVRRQHDLYGVAEVQVEFSEGHGSPLLDAGRLGSLRGAIVAGHYGLNVPDPSNNVVWVVAANRIGVNAHQPVLSCSVVDIGHDAMEVPALRHA